MEFISYLKMLLPVYKELKHRSTLESNSNRKLNIINRILVLPINLENKIRLINLVTDTYSEHGQDLLMLLLSNFKLNGIFVDVGASNGIECSNTKFLEEWYGWSGLLVEPNTRHHQMLDLRKSKKYFGAAAKENGLAYFYNKGSLSFTQDKKRYDHKVVECRTIESLLCQYFNTDSTIDFLSIDIEGNEFEVLSNFEFSKWKIKYFIIEHNYSEQEKLLDNLMEFSGYKRFLRSWSNQDAYYYHISQEKKILDILK